MSRTSELANKLSKRAENLETAGSAVLWITLLGSAILIIVGLIPVCPPTGFDCYESDKTQTWSLVITGLTSALIAWWIFALSEVIAGQAQLAAEVTAPVAAETPSAE